MPFFFKNIKIKASLTKYALPLNEQAQYVLSSYPYTPSPLHSQENTSSLHYLIEKKAIRLFAVFSPDTNMKDFSFLKQ
jgi:hypothetical protein